MVTENPLVAVISAQLEAADGMVDDTVAFVLAAASEHIRARAYADKAQFPQHSNGRVGLLSAAHMIDPEGDGLG